MAKNFNVPESTFDNLKANPSIFNGNVSDGIVSGVDPDSEATGASSFVYRTFEHPSEPVPGNGGTFYKIDSTNFPIAKTIAATFVILEPGGLRELHWHPNVSRFVSFTLPASTVHC